MRRIQSGQSGEMMINQHRRPARRRAVSSTSATGPIASPRANCRSTSRRARRASSATSSSPLRDWIDANKYLHDLIAIDRRNPTVNAYGTALRLAGILDRHDADPRSARRTRSRTSRCRCATRTCRVSLGPGHAARSTPLQPSRLLGRRGALGHARQQPQLDVRRATGRVWLAATVRGLDNPAFCKKGSDHPSARVVPARAHRPRAGRDARSEDDEVHLRRHLLRHASSAVRLRRRQHAVDVGRRSGGRLGQHQASGTRPDDAQKAQGWTPFVLDTTATASATTTSSPTSRWIPARTSASIRLGPLRRDAASDRRLDLGSRSACSAARPARFSATIPQTALAEIYNVPAPGFGVRGGDIDKNGVVWVSLASGHLGSFDRRKCKGPLNGPKATGDHCPEGWAFHKYPGPGFDGIGENSAEVELLHLGRPAQHVRASARTCRCRPAICNDGFIALKDGKMVAAARALSAWASTPRASTAASTIRRPAGRAAACGAQAATARRG